MCLGRTREGLGKTFIIVPPKEKKRKERKENEKKKYGKEVRKGGRKEEIIRVQREVWIKM